MRRLLVVACLLLAGCSASTAPRASTPLSSSPAVPSALSWPLPLDQYTPGALTPGCTYPRATTERAVTTATKTAAAHLYGYTGPAGLGYLEYDHRIPFSLCGSNGVANIWPEVTDGVGQSTYVHNRKDQLELFVARQVRYGRMRLADAQNLFRGDWRLAWCRYLHYPGVSCP